MTCPVCQASNPAGARFCNNCGSLLGTSAASEAERRLVSILFADVVGSTALAEKVDPEEWTEVMNGVIRFMINAVTRYEGTVARLMGDGILALFGAPASHEDDAERAVLAALAIRDSAAEYSLRVKRGHGFELAVRSGVNTGLSVLTRVGDENKAEYTAMGDAANLAARLQALAPPQGVLIGPETHDLVRHAFVTRPLGEEHIRGKATAVSIFEVTSPRVGVAKARGLDSGESPFVGREQELNVLSQAAERARQGQANLVFVVGEAGLGKSRLLAELRRGLGQQFRWLEGRAVSYARMTPYLPWRQLLLTSLGTPPGADNDRIRRDLAELHRGSRGGHGQPNEATGRGNGEALRPALFESLSLLLGVDDGPRQGSTHGSDADDPGKLITSAVAAHLGRLAADAPLIVVLEDLHWADQASVRLVENLAASLGEARVLLVCSLRPERNTPAWSLLERAKDGALAGEPGLASGAGSGGAPGSATVIALDALEGQQAARLLDDLVDVEGMPAETRAMILRKAEGNPFYLEEVIRSLIDSGHIVKDSGRWFARAEIVDVSVPDTLVGVLSGRLDSLPDDTRRVAQTASVIGRDFASRLLAAVMEGSAENGGVRDLAPQLRTLTLEELINQTGPGNEIDYRFKHELTKDAAYEQLLLRRRRELHGRVGDQLAALYGDYEGEIAEDMARHYEMAERWLEASRWSLTAASSARRLYALPDAAELVEDALRLNDLAMAGATSSHEGPEEAGDASAGEVERLRAAVLTELVKLGILTRVHEDPKRRPKLLERAEEAVSLARRLADDRTLVTSLVNLGNVHVLSGFPMTGFEHIIEAHALAAELGDEQLFLWPLWVATEILVDDAPADAAEQFDQVIELARKVRNKEIEAHALGTKTAALARLGEFNAALEVGRVALATAEASGSIIKRADVGLLVGSAYLEMGQVETGLEHITRGTELALSVNGMECACSGLYLLGVGQLEENKLTEAQQTLNRSLGFAVDAGYEGVLHNVRASLAGARFMAGDVAAIVAIEQEIENAEAFNDGYGAARARVMLASGLLSIGKADRAKGHVKTALEWFEARTMRPYVLRGLNLLSAVLSALGDEQGSAAAKQRAAEVKTAIDWPVEVPATMDPDGTAGQAAQPGGD